MQIQYLRIIAILSSAGLTACSTMTNSILNREIQENEIAVAVDRPLNQTVKASVLGMSENRRGILIRDNRRLPDGTPVVYYCAEPPPDVAMSTQAGFSAGLTATAQALKGQPEASAKAQGKVVDQYTRVALQLANRTTLLDVYRTAVFSLCQMHMNGAITHREAEKLFRDVSLEVIRKIPETETPSSGGKGDRFDPIEQVDLDDDGEAKEEAPVTPSQDAT